ncbi:MAG: DUF429 domain-containing protein [Chloroflexota bacterium]|nr:DUF429 domain-containing protein [Chloroflexota bacterium]MDE2942022.1 DUF429 domain-containing protein [Chloroflexota bacterium]MDE3267120.1 DUF429 domain-containing protein [Chloroflexota bacterium]
MPGRLFSVALDWNGSLVRCGVFKTFEKLLECNSDAKLVFVDMPIGLSEDGTRRACDDEARCVLKRRASSVFTTPTRLTARVAMCTNSYKAASCIEREFAERGLSQQSFHIARKIAELDTLLTANIGAPRPPIREVHPEVCFWALNEGKPMSHNKKKRLGKDERPGEYERLRVLGHRLPPVRSMFLEMIDGTSRSQVARDDILDALAAAVTGWLWKSGRGTLATLPAVPPRDSRGLPMEMVYCTPDHA